MFYYHLECEIVLSLNNGSGQFYLPIFLPAAGSVRGEIRLALGARSDPAQDRGRDRGSE